MKLETEVNGHKLVGKTLKGGLVEISSISPEGDSVVIGTYYPPELVDYESEDILDNEELTREVGELLLKLGRRWE